MTVSPRKTVAAYALLMAFCLTTTSEVCAKTVCTGHKRRKPCINEKINDCVFVKFGGYKECLPRPTAEKCNQITQSNQKQKRKACRKLGCEWDQRNRMCLDKLDEIDTIDHDNDNENNIAVDDESDNDSESIGANDSENGPIANQTPIKNDVDTDNDRESKSTDDEIDEWGGDRVPYKPENRDDISEFWESVIGMNVDEAIDAIDDEFSGFYQVYICPHVQCFMRNHDSTRVKVEIDADNEVVKSVEVG